MELYGKYFYGNEISPHGQKHNRLDYGTLAKAFQHVLHNDIMGISPWDKWQFLSGPSDPAEEIDSLKEELQTAIEEEEDAERIEELETKIEELEEEQDKSSEIFQWYIVSEPGAKLLQELNEIVYYNETFNLYVWGVTHWGTAWDYVLTDVPCNTKSPETEGASK